MAPAMGSSILKVNTKDTMKLLLDDKFEAFQEEVTIIPNFGTDQPIECIKGKFGPFRAHTATKVPLWAAMQLEQLQQCIIELPKWLQADELKKMRDDEKANPNMFPKVPRYYIEIAFALFALPRSFHGDEMLRSRTVLMLREIIELRRDKIIEGIKDFDTRPTEINLTNMSAAEITCFRTRSLHVLDNFVDLFQNRRLEKPPDGNLEGEGEEETPQDDSSHLL
eukprot:TRINITY_DN13514_c3_g1_i1.p1 TRINITY_DN13514_c3_g1~~TRINITY_DN13514_c3_g1_i1.p1  ORF type:complete len:256 (+),score=49.32 TRINITY_DN13514_c3_g1_i1:102-770(+)